MVEIKTIFIKIDDCEKFDKLVNEALAEGWELVRRDVLVPHVSDRFTLLYAELERVIETESEDEETEDDGTAEWVVSRDPAHPYRCNKCGRSTSAPSGFCIGCGRAMVSYRG